MYTIEYPGDCTEDVKVVLSKHLEYLNSGVVGCIVLPTGFNLEHDSATHTDKQKELK